MCRRVEGVGGRLGRGGLLCHGPDGEVRGRVLRGDKGVLDTYWVKSWSVGGGHGGCEM